jgi:hypothetical protein
MVSVPATDISSLSIKSDGTRLTLSATLSDAPGAVPSTPVTIYVDADNNSATGAKADPQKGVPAGAEFKAGLTLCIGYGDGSESCAGGSKDPTVKKRYAAVNLDRYKSGTPADEERVMSAIGFPGKSAVQSPVSGKVVEASLAYADLGVKPGQTIKLYASKTGGTLSGHADFPVPIVLTLK